MATHRELDNIYKGCYMKLLDMLGKVKLSEPDMYDFMRRQVSEYRAWTAEVSGIKGLQEVPDK